MKVQYSLSGIIAVVLAASASSAQAQETPAGSAAVQTSPQADDETQNADIVVTANKREQSVREVPLAIQAFSGEALEKQGVKSAADILTQVPSASFATSTPTGSILQLRGISQNAAADPTVAFYVDEIPFGLPGAPTAPNVDALDLARIEVLRGPQGTLYGLGAMGGTVRVITEDPDPVGGFSGRVLAEGSTLKGGDASYLGGLAVNVPLVNDVLAGRVSVSYRHNGGYVDDIGRGEKNVNDDDSFSIRGKLLFRPTADLTVKLSLWRNEVDTNWSNQAFYKNTTIRDFTGPASAPAAFLDTNFTVASGFVSYDFGFATLEDSLSYYRGDQQGKFVIGTPPPPAGLGLLQVDTSENSRAWTNELRLVSPGNKPFQWIVGTFYRDVTRNTFQAGGFEFLPGSVPPTDATIKTKSISLFGEASYGFADDLVRVLVGGRYFHDDRSYVESTLNPLTGLPLTTSLKPKFDSFNPRFNITLKPSSDALIYFNAAKGFRSGIINTAAQTIFAGLDGINGIQIVQPDSIWTYEVGAKLTLADRRLFLEAAVFYSDWKDFQFGGATSSGFGFTTNGGDARIKGIEGSITWNTPLHGLTFAANGSYNEPNFKTVSPLVANASPLFVPGSRLPTVPKWSGAASLNYDGAIGGGDLHFVAGSTLTFRGNQFDSTGKVDPVLGIPIVTDSRAELSLRAGLRKDRFEVTVFANNVTNNLRSVGSLTSTQWYAPLPRQIGIRLSGGF